jgi:hypothetical protein
LFIWPFSKLEKGKNRREPLYTGMSKICLVFFLENMLIQCGALTFYQLWEQENWNLFSQGHKQQQHSEFLQVTVHAKWFCRTHPEVNFLKCEWTFSLMTAVLGLTTSMMALIQGSLNAHSTSFRKGPWV